MRLRERSTNLGDIGNTLEAAKSRLRQSPYPVIRSIRCAFKDGVLRLDGRVHSFYQKQLAQAAVIDLPGVARIVNRTHVIAPAGR